MSGKGSHLVAGEKLDGFASCGKMKGSEVMLFLIPCESQGGRIF
jgi:hypothetical protein